MHRRCRPHSDCTYIFQTEAIELKARAATFKERDTNLDTYKKSRYALRRTIKQAKRHYMITGLFTFTPHQYIASLLIFYCVTFYYFLLLVYLVNIFLTHLELHCWLILTARGYAEKAEREIQLFFC